MNYLSIFFVIAVVLTAFKQSSAIKMVGEKCKSHHECYTGYCDVRSGRCADKPNVKPTPRIPNGSPCRTNVECLSGYCHNNNICADKTAKRG